MVIKAEVNKDQRDKIRELASSAGMSISCVAHSVLNRIRDIATRVIHNNVIYEADIIELLDRISWIDGLTASLLKEANRSGNPGQ